MSLTAPFPDAQEIAHTALGHACFLCGQPTKDPAVHWMGADGEIYLHPDCVVALVIALFRDLAELKQRGEWRP